MNKKEHVKYILEELDKNKWISSVNVNKYYRTTEYDESIGRNVKLNPPKQITTISVTMEE